MDSTKLCQSNTASLPPPEKANNTLAQTRSDRSRARRFKPRVLPTPAFQSALALHPDRPPPAPIGFFLANSLRSRWDFYKAQLRGCRNDFSEGTVHELRVATRRLLAHLVMLERTAPGTAIKRTTRVLKKRLKPLGGLRDLHVQRLFIERRLARFPELKLVRDSLLRRERRLERSVARKVRKSKTRKLEKWISSVEAFLAWNDGRQRSDEMSGFVAKAVAEAFAGVVRKREAIAPDQLETIHETRIAFKKFRYMVEALSPDLTGLSKRELRQMARYQRRMGTIQDLEVMQQWVAGQVRKREGMDALLRRFTRNLQASRTRALRVFLKSADELFKFWPPGRVFWRELANRQDAA